MMISKERHKNGMTTLLKESGDVMAINSKQKGNTGEREISKILREYGFKDAKRSQQYCGYNGDADVIGIPGLHLEVKRVEKLNLDKAYEQARRDAKEGEKPVVMHRKNRQEWKVTLSLEDFMEIFKGVE